MPSQLSFAYQKLNGPPTLPEQIILVSTPDRAIVTATATSEGGNWLSVSHGGTTPTAIHVAANAADLAVGTYSGAIALISSGYAPTSVPVTLTVSEAPVLNVSPTSLEFSFQQGSSLPTSQTLSVTSSSTPLIFSASSSTTPWLFVIGGGTTPGNLSVAVIPATLSPGTYDGTLIVSSAQAGNSPVPIRVRLNVTQGPLVQSQPTSLHFDYTQRQALPPPQSVSISSSQALSFSTSVTGSQSWLTVSGGDRTDTSLNVSVQPIGLDPGTYIALIVINAPDATNNPIGIPVTLTVHEAPRIETSLDHVVFAYRSGGQKPANQVVVVTSSNPSSVVTGVAVNEPGQHWLSVSGGGEVPSLFSISANPAGLAPGIYNASVVFASFGAGNSPLSLPVTLLVSAAPVMEATPTELSLSYQIGGSVPPVVPIQVTSSGAPITFQVTASTETGGSWLSASSGGTTPAFVMVSIHPEALSPGIYAGAITLQSPTAGNTLVVPVTLTVSASPSLTAAPNSVSFAAQQNGLQPSPQAIQITSGNAAIPVSYVTSPGAPWLTIAGGTTTPDQLVVSASSAGLPPGSYSAVILAQSSQAANSPLRIPVSLDVTAEPVLQTDPSVLHFSYTIGGAIPTYQTFQVTSSSTNVSYTASVLPGASWLLADASGLTPGSVAVSVNPGALDAGIYHGTIQVTSPSTTRLTQVNVILTVSVVPTLSTTPTQLIFSYQINGQIPTGQSVVVQSSPRSVLVTAELARLGNGPWVTVTGGGLTPAPFLVEVNPVGLSPGVYRQEIAFHSPEALDTILPVILRVTNAPTLVSGADEITFTATAGGSPPANRPVVIFASDGSALPITAQVSSGLGWLSVASNSDFTPGTLTVSANPAGLPAGSYFGSIIVSTTAPGVEPLVIPVEFKITTLPELVVVPSAISFSTVPMGPPLPPVPVVVGTEGVPLNFTATPGPGSGWLSVSGGGTTPSMISITADPGGLSPGTYHGRVVLVAKGASNPVFMPVDLLLSNAPIVTATPTALFSAKPVVTNLPLTVSATVPGTPITATASAETPWLRVSGGGASPQLLSVLVDPGGMPPGSYQGAVQVIATGTVNSPLLVPVVMVVQATPSLEAAPSTLEFHYDSPGPQPGPQTVTITLGGQPATSAQAIVAPGTPWLSIASVLNGIVSVAVNPSGLAAGDYTGSIQVTAPDAANSPLTIPVRFSVTGVPTLSLSKDAIAFAAVVSQSQPLSTILGIASATPIDLQFDVTGSTWLSIGQPNGRSSLNVTVLANPAGLRPGNYAGSVRISSNGLALRTVPVNLTVGPDPTLGVSPPLLTFKYSHGGDLPAPANVYLDMTQALTIQATSSHSWVSVALGATTSAPSRVTVNPSGLAAGIYHESVTLSAADPATGAILAARTVPVDLYVDQPAAPRIISSVNGMSFLPTPLAPGLIFSIFGTDLGPVLPETSKRVSDLLPTTLAGVQVFVNGVLCPMMYVSEKQINAIAPYALYTKSSATVVVQRNGLLSNELPLQVAPSSPGLFSISESGTGPGVILNQDQRSNSPQNPATRGSIISLFGGGDGQTAPHGIDGLVASSPLPVSLLPVSVFIGGIPALDISYYGAEPAQVSVFQVNVRIPENTPSGNVPVLVRLGETSQQLLTVAIEGVRRSRQ